MKKYNFIFLLALIVMIASCKETDVVKPEIGEFTLNDLTEDIVVAAGTDIHVDAVFTDNENLKEYKIDIHDDFDGHGHNKTNANTRFSFLQIYPISGKTATEHQDIEVASEVAAGPYHCNVRVLDEEGNEGDILILKLLITNNGQPVVGVTAPDFSTEVSIGLGQTLGLQGTITDDVDLQEISIVLAEEDHSHGKKEGIALETPIYEADFDLTGASDMSWDFAELTNTNQEITIPTTAELAHYTLTIRVLDSDDNMTIWEGEVHVE